MRFFVRFFFCILFYGMISYAAARPVTTPAPLYPFPQPEMQLRFQHLLKNLRCLVCQNQDLADSQASLAEDLRSDIYKAILQGKTDEAILARLKSRYSDFIFLSPPLQKTTYALWLGPFVLFMGAIATLLTLLYKRKG